MHFHIEKFDGLVDQIGLIWVDVPDLAPGTATSFYLYWGNKNAQPGGDAKATYDPDQLLVYHFTEENGVPHDATGYGNNALTAGKRDDGGMIGYGLRLDGTTPVQIPASPSLKLTAGQPTTWSVWARLNDGVTTGVLYSQRDGANAFTIGLDQGGRQVTVPLNKEETTLGAGAAECRRADAAYGVGLLSGAVTSRTLLALTPHITKSTLGLRQVLGLKSGPAKS